MFQPNQHASTALWPNLAKLLKRTRKRILGRLVTRKPALSRTEFNRNQQSYETWCERNPDRPFKDFYAERKAAQVTAGVAQSTFGANLKSGSFEESGFSAFQELVELGLKPGDVCVDYGCGTLRIGYHAINYLGAGRYWGFDIADWLLAEGLELIGDDLAAEKKPNLRVISAESVAEAAAERPDFVFSAKVQQHVHPDELREYYRNLMTLIGDHGQAFVFSKWSAQETKQYRVAGWSHSIDVIRQHVAALDGRIEILYDSDRLLPLEGSGYTKRGMLRLVHRSAS